MYVLLHMLSCVSLFVSLLSILFHPIFFHFMLSFYFHVIFYVSNDTSIFFHLWTCIIASSLSHFSSLLLDSYLFFIYSRIFCLSLVVYLFCTNSCYSFSFGMSLYIACVLMVINLEVTCDCY